MKQKTKHLPRSPEQSVVMYEQLGGRRSAGAAGQVGSRGRYYSGGLEIKARIYGVTFDLAVHLVSTTGFNQRSIDPIHKLNRE